MTTTTASAPVATEHSATSDGLRIHVLEKRMENGAASVAGETRAVLLVHGGTYSGPTDFDLQVPGKDYSLMDHLAERGSDVFTFAVRGYGSRKGRTTPAP